MKNCQIIIKRRDHHTVVFTFDDLRVAQAITNILDNVAENSIDNMFSLQYINKEIYEE